MPWRIATTATSCAAATSRSGSLLIGWRCRSPGGLYGSVTEEKLEEEQSTRNRLLMQLMEDVQLVENRGSGIRGMLDVMRGANLEPPRFDDKRSSFWVTFRNHTLMSPEAVAWLNQFAAQPINDHQRLALVYLRLNDQITNRDYQRLNHVDSVTANRELRGLVQAELIEQHSTRRWAYYTLREKPEIGALPLEVTDEEKILAYVRERGSINNTECRDLLQVNLQRASHLLKKMQAQGKLKREGERRWARYRLP
ncbi:MAG: ATP-binding protein [Blastocatellia bacterium]